MRCDVRSPGVPCRKSNRFVALRECGFNYMGNSRLLELPVCNQKPNDLWTTIETVQYAQTQLRPNAGFLTKLGLVVIQQTVAIQLSDSSAYNMQEITG